MKKPRYAKKLLEELHIFPNKSLACKKLGLSRNTVYRWCKEDCLFKDMIEEAMEIGRESINDLAESTVVQHIKGGDLKAAKYWLDNNKKNYIKPRPDVPGEDFYPDKIEVEIIKDRDQLEKSRKIDAFEKKYGPIDIKKSDSDQSLD